MTKTRETAVGSGENVKWSCGIDVRKDSGSGDRRAGMADKGAAGGGGTVAAEFVELSFAKHSRSGLCLAIGSIENRVPIGG